MLNASAGKLVVTEKGVFRNASFLVGKIRIPATVVPSTTDVDAVSQLPPMGAAKLELPQNIVQHTVYIDSDAVFGRAIGTGFWKERAEGVNAAKMKVGSRLLKDHIELKAGITLDATRRQKLIEFQAGTDADLVEIPDFHASDTSVYSAQIAKDCTYVEKHGKAPIVEIDSHNELNSTNLAAVQVKVDACVKLGQGVFNLSGTRMSTSSLTYLDSLAGIFRNAQTYVFKSDSDRAVFDGRKATKHATTMMARSIGLQAVAPKSYYHLKTVQGRKRFDGREPKVIECFDRPTWGLLNLEERIAEYGAKPEIALGFDYAWLDDFTDYETAYDGYAVMTLSTVLRLATLLQQQAEYDAITAACAAPTPARLTALVGAKKYTLPALRAAP